MKKHGMPRSAWVLLGMLCIAATVLTLGERDTTTNPTANSYGPSGTHLLQDLLRDQGYRVDVSTSETPHLDPEDLAVAFYIPDRRDLFDPEPTTSPDKTVNRSLARHLENGGVVLSIAIASNFNEASKAVLAAPTPVESPQGAQKRLSVWNGFEPAAPVFLSGEEAYPLWKFPEGTEWANAWKYEKGLVVTLIDGLPATNRFIDREDNAEVMLGLIRSLVPKNGRIVLTEATFGNTGGDSLIAAIGPWAEGAWMQLVLLFGVVVISLGYRFGLAEEHRAKERGQRELLDAVADTYLRGRMTTVALAAAYEDVDLKLRKALKLPKNASDADRDARLPDRLVDALRSVHEQSLVGTSSRKAAALAEKLYAEAGEFLTSRAASDPMVSARTEI